MPPLPPLLLLGCLLFSLPATAKDPREWEFVINFPMAWLPDISGDITTDGDRTSVEIPIEDILENLDAGFIGELYVNRGNWGLSWRSMYLRTESKSQTRALTGLPGRPPIIGQHKLKVENELFTSDLILSYRPYQHFGVYTGVRRTGNKTKFKIRPAEDGLINIRFSETVVDEELYDWIAGVELAYGFSDRWLGVIQADTGLSGDNDTNRQVNAFFSYSFNDRHAAWFGYRYLLIGDKTREDGSRTESEFVQQGPTIGWAFTF